MKTYIATFLFLLSTACAVAQPYLIKRLGIEQGLSNNYVVSITQDKQGFLWFATEEGLNKFDGTRFITYYKKEQSAPVQSITGNELNEVSADPSLPIIWIATQRTGLNAYNYETRTFTAYRNDPEDPNSLITNDVTHIATSLQPDSGLWVCTYYRGIDYLDKATGKFTHYNKSTLPALPSDQTWTLMEDKDSQLYIGHVEGGLSILSLKDKSVKHYMHDPQDPNSLPGNDVRSIFKDSNGNIWIGTSKGLALFNTEAETFTNFHHNPTNLRGALSGYIFDIKQIKGNKLWIATELNGIMTLDLRQNQFLLPEQIRFESIPEGDNNYSLSNVSIRNIFQDSFDNVWIGTWGGGINFIGNTPPAFNTWTYSPTHTNENALTYKVISSICSDEQGRMWIGTNGDGINVFENGKRVAVYNKENAKLISNSVLCSLRDSENNLWFGTFLGNISFYDSRTKSFRIIEPEKNQQIDVRTLHEDRNRQIWVGTHKGIYVISLADKKVMRHYDTSNCELPENFVRSITQDSKGRFWIGTFGGGIGVYTPEMELIKRFNQYEGFCSNTINQIYAGKQGQIWVATGDGLVCFPSADNSFDYEVFQRKDGLPNTHIRAVAEDKNGNIWASTNIGISCYLTDKKTFYNYDHYINIPQGNFMSGCVAEDKQGMIYFGSINGVCFFNPDIVVHAPEPPAVVITEIKIPGRLTNEKYNETVIPTSNGQIELTHEQNSFSLTFNVQDYSLANQVEYAYMLKGLENSWYTINDLNSVTFRNIPPGNYEFLIKARLHNQDWSETVTSLPIRITPPIWLTWWAKLIYILVSMGLVYLFLYAYKRKIDVETLYILEKKNHEQEQELNQERLRFYTNITHELRTPLTLILGPLEDMQKDKTLPAKQSKKLAVIHQSALRLLNLINQILEFRKTETQNKKLCVSKANIAPLIHEIGLKYKELNQKPSIDFFIHVEKEDMCLFFDKEIVMIILDNLISNAIKYTEQGRITLSLYPTVRNEVEYTEIKVSDTGYGISAEALPHIFDRYYQESGKHQASGTGIGLALVKNLVDLHEGEIRVESEPNAGSSFYISLLTDNIYPNALHSDSATTDEETEVQEENAEGAQEAATDSGKPILLIVEDNEEIKKYIAESFSDSFEVITAGNGEEGLQQAFASIPDIIVSDIMMPVMDGTTLCRQLKQDVRTSHIPIILLTAKDSLQDKEEGYEVGADSYLTKPFSASLLRSRINNLLESRKKLTALFQSPTTTDATQAPVPRFENKRLIITEALSRIDNEFIEKITQLIEENLSLEKIDITYLSDKMCMSGSTLYRKMKALTGLSTNEYIRKVKMRNAELLILEGKYNISEVAFKVGMNSVGYFRQCFKEEFGMSPSEYLKQISTQNPPSFI